MRIEVKNMLGDRQFLDVAPDWRLMTKAEVLDYRKRQQQEAQDADRHHQEGERAGPTQG